MGSCLLLGYPVAWLLANLPMRHANLSDDPCSTIAVLDLPAGAHIRLEGDAATTGGDQ